MHHKDRSCQSSPPRPPDMRRQGRRSLKVNLLWVLAAAVVQVCHINNAVAGAQAASEEAEAVAAIEKLGGRVERDEKRPNKPVVLVSLYSTKVTDVNLVHLECLKKLKRLHLPHTSISDAGLAHLKGLTN